MASTLTVGGVTTLNGKFLIDGSNNDLMTFRTTGDTSSQVLGLQFQNNSEAVTAQIFGTGDNSSSGVFRIKGIGDVAIVGGDIGVTGAAGDLVVKSGGDVHVGTGDLIFATADKGIVLGATSNTAANTLDDYEEGTWTAKIAGNDGNESDTTVTGNYTKIGNLVYAEFASLNNVNTTGIGSSAILNIKTLPFTVGATGALGHISANILNFSTSTNVNINVSAAASSTIMSVIECNDNGSRNSLAIASITDDQTDFSQVTIMYRTA